MTHFAFDDQIASQFETARDVLKTVDVPKLDPTRPVILAGTGTSLHAAQVAGYWARELSGNRIRPFVVETHEYALRGAIQSDDQIVVVSHRGTKRFPHALFERAKKAGASTIAVSGYGAENPGGDIVLRTCADERASTHTVSYTRKPARGLSPQRKRRTATIWSSSRFPRRTSRIFPRACLPAFRHR